jgi:hypothetical protein
MREHIKFGLIKNTQEFEGLKAFAESFLHHVGVDSILPIYTIERGDQMLGYFNVLTYPVVFPAMHPGLTTPRDLYETLHALKNHYCLNSIDGKFTHGTGLMAIPKNVAAETARAFKKAGFMPMNKEIWQAVP